MMVLVPLDERRLSPDLDVSLPRHLRAIRDAGPDVLLFEPRIVRQDLGDGPAAGQEVEDQRDPDAMPPEARLAEADVGIDRDPGEYLIACHGILVRQAKQTDGT